MEKAGKIISLANLKGGCGKTTLATNLAVMFVSENHEVMLIDADPKAKTTMNWSANRGKREEEMQLPFIQCGIVTASDMRRQASAYRKKFDIIIVDGGAGVTDTAKAACAVADFLIIPLKPSGADTDATAEYLIEVAAEQSTRDDLMVGLAFNEIDLRTVLARETVEQVEGWAGVVTFETKLGQYEDFRKALTLGLGVSELNAKSKACQNFTKFYQELRGALNA